MGKDVLLTGGRPTGKLHIGHYLGALREFVNIQDQYETFLIISDIHMLTTAASYSSISQIWENAVDMVLDVIAMGADPEKTTFYLQSNVKEMPYFYTLIQNFIDMSTIQNTPSLVRTINEMKDNASMEEISLGLLAYPVMEVADILSMQADVVTVGKDNIDHVEIARKIASRINVESNYKLTLPKYITTDNNQIIGIDGKNKMSKSLRNCIYISDTKEIVLQKVLSMPWDERLPYDTIIGRYLRIFFPYVFGESFPENDYLRGERFCKTALFEALETLLGPMRQRRSAFSGERAQIERYILSGTEKAREITNNSLKRLKEGLGYNVQHCI